MCVASGGAIRGFLVAGDPVRGCLDGAHVGRVGYFLRRSLRVGRRRLHDDHRDVLIHMRQARWGKQGPMGGDKYVRVGLRRAHTIASTFLGSVVLQSCVFLG